MTIFWIGFISGAGGAVGVAIILIALLRGSVGPKF